VSPGPQRWGVLGGTFDPVHFAHLAMAEQTREQLDLAGVIFVPAGQPVHKPATQASAADRLRMVELAIADNPCFEVSPIEVNGEVSGYSVDTVARLAADRPVSELVFIMSADAATQLPTWRQPERLLELCQVAIVPRADHATPTRDWLAGQFPGQADRFLFVDGSRLSHSASDIRARLAAGRSVRYLVPPTVEAYIRQHQLYGSDG
jgi:nicotinate-nucleotide adenylyltransferase